MDHQQIEESLGAYVVGALSDRERIDFEAHVNSCAQCAARVSEFRRVANLLPLSVDMQTPPARLKTKLLAQVEQYSSREKTAGVQSADGFGTFLRRLFSSPKTAASFAVAAVLLIAAVFVLNQDLRDKNREIARLERSVFIADAAGTDAAPGATGKVVYLTDQKIAVLQVQGLPVLPQGQTYQLWLIAGTSAPVSAGLFQVDSAAQPANAIINGDPSKYGTLAVSVETAGGVPSPTGKIVLTADL